MITDGYVMPSRIIPWGDDSALLIGSLYQNDLFYAYGSSVLPKHAYIRCENGITYFWVASSDGVSVNPKEGRKKTVNISSDKKTENILDYTDVLSIFGLKIINLGRYLLIDCLYGDMRLAVKEASKNFVSR